MHTTHSNTQYKNESNHSEMGPVRQSPIQRTVSLFICVCIATDYRWTKIVKSGTDVHHAPASSGQTMGRVDSIGGVNWVSGCGREPTMDTVPLGKLYRQFQPVNARPLWSQWREGASSLAWPTHILWRP